MTLEQTRQLGIEFERRVQVMIPEKEYDKLDTETIYSFLNQYQDMYIRDIYNSLDNIPSGTKISARVESILQALLVSENISIADATKNVESDSGRSVTYNLSEQFYMYLRSVSKVSSTYSFKNRSSAGVIPNQLVSQNDLQKVIETPVDNLRILRNPIAALSKYNDGNPTITVVYDRYTTPTGIEVLYYKQPAYFDLMTSTKCELPMEMFEDLVTGAVDLYVNYVAGAEAKKRQQQEAARRQQENNRKRNEEE